MTCCDVPGSSIESRMPDLSTTCGRARAPIIMSRKATVAGHACGARKAKPTSVKLAGRDSVEQRETR
jgi:hypothetical protein